MILHKNIIFTSFVGVALLLLLLVPFIANAKLVDVLRTDQAEIKLLGGEYVDAKIQLGLSFNLQPGWHIYWRVPGETGFPPVLEWNGSANINGIKFMWPAPLSLKQELQPGMVALSYIYKNQITFPIEIAVQDKAAPAVVKLHVDYAICKDICIPGQADLNLQLQSGDKSLENMHIIAEATKMVPQENGVDGMMIEAVNHGVFKGGEAKFIEVYTTRKIDNFSKDAEVFIDAGENFSFGSPVITIIGKTAKFIFPVKFLTQKKDFLGSSLSVVLVNNKRAVELVIDGNKLGVAETLDNVNSAEYSANTLLLMIIFGFIGGLILNIMPCVLPVLSIKILGVIKHGGGNYLHVKKSFLLTACGILVTFVAFALITIWLKMAGSVVGWGFHFQQPYFIMALVIILTFFAANMWGIFNVKLPEFIGNFGLNKKYTENMEHFMAGVLATLLATPCTAPFLGTAVGFSVTRGWFEILAIFTAMGMGLSFPYLIFSIFPKMITALPKPGMWMITVKKIMSILLALAAIWLLWVLVNQLGKKVPNNNDITSVAAHHEIWEDFRPEHIKGLVLGGRIVFVDITADWCLTCKINKLMVLSSDEIMDVFKSKNVVAMQADWTSRDDHIAQYIMKYQRVGIPFNIVYGPGAPEGIVLSELLKKADVIEAIGVAGRVKEK